MKTKSFSKKLELNKTTVSNLGKSEMNDVLGQAIILTDPNGNCYTMYKDYCMSVDPRYCAWTYHC